LSQADHDARSLRWPAAAWLRAATAGTTALLLAACASAPASGDGTAATPAAASPSGISAGDEPAADAAVEAGAVSDPLEPFNRVIYGFNWYLDHLWIRPIAYAYRDGVPEPAREGVRNVLRNLKSPIVLFNDALQGEWERAETTGMRFLINTTVGVLGLFDVAATMGYPYHDEDFGQTLAVHGTESGPYLMLPLLGPSNFRDGAGLAVDWALDPFRWYGATQNPNWHPEAEYTRTGLRVLDARTALLDPLEELETSSIDDYAALRTMYAQIRAAAIRNARPGQTSAAQVKGDAFDFEE
jgi:phospholipid-binding lipoprotein MlaA